ncbi:MAG: hypothetical protein J5543_07345 [Bacteroidales bacterium]|nr:hypothetical protein [Bacteroidales bacterium]
MKRIVTLFLLIIPLALSGVRAQTVKVKVLGGNVTAAAKENIEQEASSLLTAFNESILEDGKKLKDKLKVSFPDKVPNNKILINSIMDLWDQSPINCSVDLVEGEVLTLFGNRGFQLRDIPVNVLDADMNNSFQDMVFSFDNDGHLTEVNMQLEKHNYNNVIINGVKEEDLVRRQMILDFVEVFRTAYNRKDIGYLKQVYSDDALIITGTILRKKDRPKDDNLMLKGLGGQQYQLVVQNKKEYIAKLQKIFSKNNYINIKFEEVSVIQHPTHEKIYGVTLKQYWNTSTYSDVGWLFLMINFEDPMNPSIEVRTWQPNEYEGREITRDEVFNLDYFTVK